MGDGKTLILQPLRTNLNLTLLLSKHPQKLLVAYFTLALAYIKTDTTWRT